MPVSAGRIRQSVQSAGVLWSRSPVNKFFLAGLLFYRFQLSGRYFLRCELHGAIVAGHFQVAGTAERLGVAVTREDDGAFPISGEELRGAG